jgi:hypothetical protein
LGIPLLRETLSATRAAQGISVYTSFSQASQRAMDLRWKYGRFIAELVIDDDSVEIERGRGGHCTIWWTPSQEQAHHFFSSVISVYPADGPSNHDIEQQARQ